MKYTSNTEAEISSQPEIWAKTLAELSTTELGTFWAATRPTNVIVTGCGSTFYLALAAASLVRDEVGIQARATPASEIALGTHPIPDVRGAILLAVSRSGTTSETLAAVERFRELGGAGVVAVSNCPNADLAGMSDVVLGAPAGQEQSVAQTRSFSSMMLLVQALVGEVAGLPKRDLETIPETGAALLATAQEPMERLATDMGISRFFFLGSDPLFGIASEGMLKLQEMSLTDSGAFHTLEFRHGPMSMAEPASAIVGLVSIGRAAAELAVVSAAADLGSATITIGGSCVVDIDEEIPGWVRPVLYLPPLQILALERARSKGLDPDRPRNLVAVIELDGLGT